MNPYIHAGPYVISYRYPVHTIRTNQTGVLVTGYQALSGRLKLLPVG